MSTRSSGRAAGGDYVGERRELVQWLDIPVRLHLVCAPTGFGKSGLVDAWMRSNSDRARTALRLPSGTKFGSDTDVWARLVKQLHMRGFVLKVPRDSARRPLTEFESAAALLNRLDDFIVLVIDDSVSKRIDKAQIEQLLDLCQRVDVVLLTDDRLWLDAIADIRFSYEIIREHDLLYTIEDTRQALSKRNIAHRPADAEVARKITSGLPSLMKFATAAFRSMLPTAPRGDHYLRTVARSLDMYVEARIYRDDTVRHLHDFIDAIAAAESLDTELAFALTHRTDINEALAELAAHGLLLVDRSATHTDRWLFPPVLREAILKRQRDEGNDPAPRLIYVAQWHREHGNHRDALLHALQAQEWSLIIDLIDAHWLTLLTQDVSTLRMAIAVIPEDRLSNRPALVAARQLLSGIGSPPGASKSVVPATLDRLRALGASRNASEALVAGTVHAVLVRISGGFAESAELARRLAILCRLMFEATPEIEIDSLALLRYQWSISHQLAGNLQESGIEAAMAYKESDAAELSFVARGAAGTSALNWALIGEHHRAAEWLERKVQQRLPALWLESIVRSAGLTARGLAALDTLDLEYSARIVDQLASVSEHDETWPVIAHLRAGFELLNARPALALDHLRRDKANSRITRQRALATSLLTTSEIELLLACGLGNQADVLAAQAGDEDWAVAARARVYGLTGRDRQAVSLSRSLSQSAAVSPRLLIEALLIEAASQLRLDQHRAAATAWTRAINLIDHLHLSRSLAYLPRAEIDALSRLVPGESSCVRYVLSLGLEPVFPDSIRFVELTEREGIVLQALAAGHGHTLIAKQLFVSTNTVKSQLRSVYRKLGAHTRDEAVDTAREMGML
ncbi:LuxR C-terminal-related transcriptional regulator [Rhodococcus sp. 1168]|uniref:helix-turn-helix transcriptional regulator n=1 Tax=Rhodococcus sp. 1168 TaxID=2018041 RepID=UPI001593DD16|nr:LuxR C-terminal-related transcriptional regulator [Rhodococcus sp. 1168]